MSESRVSKGKIFLYSLLAVLFIGVVIPTVFYLIWGILEMAQIPVAS